MTRAIAVLAAAVGVWIAVTAATSPVPPPDLVRIRHGDDPAWADPGYDDRHWEQVPWRRVDPQGRVLWVRARAPIPADFDADTTPLAVYVSALAAYEVYWNGVLIGGSGKPGATAAEEIPGRLDTSHYVPPHLLRAENVVALKMSSFHLRRAVAGPFQFFSIEAHGGPQRRIFMSRIPMLVAAGALMLGAAYFAAMFVSDRKDQASLLLSLLALAALAQLAAEGARFVSYPYPLQILRLEAILAAASASGVLLTLHVASRYAPASRRGLLIAAIAMMTAVAVLVPGFDGKTALVIVSALVVVSAAAAIGIRARLPGAAATAGAAAAVLVLFAVDPSRFVDQTYYIAATAFLLFLFAQQVTALRRAQATRAAAQLRSARLELELLKRQIQPHFLLNTLTAATEWIESEPKTGVRMIEALADELRALATMSDKTLVPIDEELALCRRHLEVMGYRRDRELSLDVEGVAASDRLPPRRAAHPARERADAQCLRARGRLPARAHRGARRADHLSSALAARGAPFRGRTRTGARVCARAAERGFRR